MAETLLAETTRSLVLTPAAEVYDLALNAEEESYALTVATERVTLRNARAEDDAATALAAQVNKDNAWSPNTNIPLPEYKHLTQTDQIDPASFNTTAGAYSGDLDIDPFDNHRRDSWGYLIIDENAYVSDVGLNGYGEGYYDGTATILNLNQSQIVDIYGPGDPNNPDSFGDFIRSELQFNHTEVAAGILGQYGNGSLRPQQDMLWHGWERGFLGLELFYRAGTAQYNDQRYPWGISHDGLPLSELQAVTPAKLSPQLTLNDNTAVAENNAPLPVDQPVSDVSQPRAVAGNNKVDGRIIYDDLEEDVEGDINNEDEIHQLRSRLAVVKRKQDDLYIKQRELHNELEYAKSNFTWLFTRSIESIKKDLDNFSSELTYYVRIEQEIREKLRILGVPWGNTKYDSNNGDYDVLGMTFDEKFEKAIDYALTDPSFSEEFKQSLLKLKDPKVIAYMAAMMSAIAATARAIVVTKNPYLAAAFAGSLYASGLADIFGEMSLPLTLVNNATTYSELRDAGTEFAKSLGRLAGGKAIEKILQGAAHYAGSAGSKSKMPDTPETPPAITKPNVEPETPGKAYAQAVATINSATKSCFTAGTPVRTPDGEKPIEQLQVGDLVISRYDGDPKGENTVR